MEHVKPILVLKVATNGVVSDELFQMCKAIRHNMLSMVDNQYFVILIPYTSDNINNKDSVEISVFNNKDAPELDLEELQKQIFEKIKSE